MSIETKTRPLPTAFTTPDRVAGYWRWTWSSSTTPPAGANLGIAFSGWTDVDEALSNSRNVEAGLEGEKFICFGGGNASGAFTADSLIAITEAINADKLADYSGIAYDVEEYSGDLRDDFAASFAAAKAKGFDVLVTISHSAPYGAPDQANAQAQMEAFFEDGNIDVLSPQLYTTGQEAANDYATTYGVEWSEFAAAKAAICPSLVDATYYESAVEYFAGQGVNLRGFIQWSQG